LQKPSGAAGGFSVSFPDFSVIRALSCDHCSDLYAAGPEPGLYTKTAFGKQPGISFFFSFS
jgi:hypothetical protein